MIAAARVPPPASPAPHDDRAQDGHSTVRTERGQNARGSAPEKVRGKVNVAKTEKTEKAEPESKSKPGRSPKHEARPAKPVKKRPVRVDPPNAPWRAYKREPWRRGYVSVVGHGKHWSGYLVDGSGDVPPLARKAFSESLASWRTGKSMLMDERLVGLVADLSDEFGGRPIRIVSGYREHSYAPDSKHKVGQAFDFSIPGVPNELLRDYLRSLPDVGVGYYPNSTHVHLDVREKPTYWVDYSRPGEHPYYSFERRIAGLTPAERELAAALDSIGLPDAIKSASPDPKLAAHARATDVRARDFEPSLSAVAPAPANGTRRVASAPDTDDADDEAEPPAPADHAEPAP
jgi:hypothetical protein